MLQFAGDIFNLSNKTRISLKQGQKKKIYIYTQGRRSMIYDVHLHRLFFFKRKVIVERLPVQRRLSWLHMIVNNETSLELPQGTRLRTLPRKHSHVFMVNFQSLKIRTTLSLCAGNARHCDGRSSLNSWNVSQSPDSIWNSGELCCPLPKTPSLYYIAVC